MIIESISMGYAGSNTYFLSKENEMIVIDPCLDPGYDASRLLAQIGNKNLVAVLLTHGHFDHISAVDVLSEKYSCDVFIHEEEIKFLNDPNLNLSVHTPDLVNLKTKAKPMSIGEQNISGFDFESFLTPGHTAYSLSYKFENHVFDGDFIFAGSIGRTDFPTGSMKTMRESIVAFDEKYAESDIVLYPGHGPKTSYKLERQRNPYIIEFIK